MIQNLNRLLSNQHLQDKIISLDTDKAANLFIYELEKCTLFCTSIILVAPDKGQWITSEVIKLQKMVQRT